jgi:hypothetical protein
LTNILEFPAIAERSLRDHAAPALRSGDADVAFIARELRMSHRPLRAVIETVRELVRHHGFPEPRTPRFVAGRRLRGADAVWKRAVWDRDAVLRWFEHDLPPGEAAARAASQRLAVRADLAARAAQLAEAL